MEGNDINDILKKTLLGEVVEPTKRVPELNISESLNAVVNKALSIEKEDRYTSVELLRYDIQKYLDGYATEAENATFLKSLSLFYSRNKLICNLSLFFISSVMVIFVLSFNKVNEERKYAILERNRAEEALLNLKNEQRKSGGLSVRYDLLDLPQKTLSKNFYFDPVKAVDNEMKYLMERGNVFSIKGQMINIVKQDFDSALRYMRKRIKNFDKDPHVKLFQKYSVLEKTESGLLEVKDLANFIKDEARFHKAYYEWMVVYDHSLREDLSGYEEVIKELLAVWNNGLNKSTFKFDTETGQLRLNGEDFKILGAQKMVTGQKSLLFTLPIKKLDIRNSKVYDLNQLRGLDILEEIDIRNSLVSDIKPLNNLPSIKRVIVSDKQFPPSVLEELKPQIIVSIK